MAVEAPLHLQRRFLPGQRHLVDSAMASLTTHTFIDMNAVVKVCKIWKIVNACPRDRLVRSKTLPHRLERRTRIPNLRMAIHTRFGGWNVREGGCLHRSVAVSTVDPLVSHVVSMAEWHGLLARDIGEGVLGRPAPSAEKPKEETDEKNSSEDAYLRKSVCAPMKDLRHTGRSAR